MKKLFFVWCGLLLIASCKKDGPQPLPSFELITYQHIKSEEAKLSATQIVVMNSTNQYSLKKGAIIFYKTKAGALGKLRIVDNGSVNQSDKLIIDLVNYNPDGTELLVKANVQVDINFNFDLDAGLQTLADADQSFAFIKIADGSKIISPELGAIFKVVTN